MIDTHTHLYDKAFNADRDAMLARAEASGVTRFMLPNIDTSTVEPMMAMCRRYPGLCFPMVGLHPTSVTPAFEEQLAALEPLVATGEMAAIGETGIDLYWERKYIAEQTASFRVQLEWARRYRLPIVIHCRKSYNEIIAELKRVQDGTVTGVFHCFPGNVRQAEEIIGLGFMLGIGGVVTYKNAEMAEVVRCIGLEHLVTETDAPYLPPVPHRGERNESAYIPFIVQKIAELKAIAVEEVALRTTENAMRLFPILATTPNEVKIGQRDDEKTPK